MAINLQDLEQHLQRRQWRYQVITEQQAILTGVVGKNIPQLAIALQLSENGECVHFQALHLLSIRDSVFKGVAFQTLLALNHHIKLLSFEYDPIDGEVRGVIELPIEDACLSDQQFDRCLNQSQAKFPCWAGGDGRLRCVQLDPGSYDMSAGLAYSENAVAWQVAQRAGLKRVLALSRQLGISTGLQPDYGTMMGQ